MAEQTIWVIGVVIAILALLIGFFIGRLTAGTRQRVAELEEEVVRQQKTLSTYKASVSEHFEQSATLFASMAGSYKDMFEHLSRGYEQLMEADSKGRFIERIGSTLLGATLLSPLAEHKDNTIAPPLEEETEPNAAIYDREAAVDSVVASPPVSAIAMSNDNGDETHNDTTILAAELAKEDDSLTSNTPVEDAAAAEETLLSAEPFLEDPFPSEVAEAEANESEDTAEQADQRDATTPAAAP